jgi:hypothetical protein
MFFIISIAVRNYGSGGTLKGETCYEIKESRIVDCDLPVSG